MATFWFLTDIFWDFVASFWNKGEKLQWHRKQRASQHIKINCTVMWKWYLCNSQCKVTKFYLKGRRVWFHSSCSLPVHYLCCGTFLSFLINSKLCPRNNGISYWLAWTFGVPKILPMAVKDFIPFLLTFCKESIKNFTIERIINGLFPFKTY
jgi:hypothetical protein